MAPTRQVAVLLACSALTLAVVASGPGTVALFSDTHVAAGNISADTDGDRTTTIDAIGESENTSTDASTANSSGDADVEGGNTSTGNASVESSSTATNSEGASPDASVESGNETTESSPQRAQTN